MLAAAAMSTHFVDLRALGSRDNLDQLSECARH
jgi:hypothetical protein